MFSYQAKTKKVMFKLKNEEKKYIKQLSQKLPERRQGKRGPKPIEKIEIITELYKLIRTNCGWRNIKYSTTCRKYLEECQRRGKIKNFFHFLIKDYKKFKPKKVSIDSSLLESYRNQREVNYSGKSHNYCTKFTLAINENYIPVAFNFAKGSKSESAQLDKMLLDMNKLPYELFMDMGYERYDRRRKLKKQGCQVRMQQAIRGKNRKRGPKFVYEREHKCERSKVERFFAWIKSFKAIRLRTTRKASLFHAFTIIALCFYI